MRVLFVISDLAVGGAQRQIVLLSKELVRLGHHASIYSLARETPRIDELAGTDVDARARVSAPRSRATPSAWALPTR